MNEISLYDDCVMLVYNKEVRENCLPFTCGESDLDDFFFNDVMQNYMQKSYWGKHIVG